MQPAFTKKMWDVARGSKKLPTPALDKATTCLVITNPGYNEQNLPVPYSLL